jgi:hypothetical protein
MIEEQIDDLDRIMAVMQAAFDPAFGEAWNRRQVGDALALPGTHYILAGTDGGEPAEGVAAAGFALSRGALDEEELLLLAVDPAYRGRASAPRFSNDSSATPALEARPGCFSKCATAIRRLPCIGVRVSSLSAGAAITIAAGRKDRSMRLPMFGPKRTRQFFRNSRC